ncbi:MAG: hypothetical protein M1820_002624 [Bogoriella megaspora]|nr:MAG: hypothetical protein M1820_002624 [Bogoriella megaspora]
MPRLAHHRKQGARDKNFLCLKCRKSGHSASDCRNSFQDDINWFYSKSREKFRFDPKNVSSASLCKQCRDLQILEWLKIKPPVKGDGRYPGMPGTKQNPDVFRLLGEIEDLKFRSDCPLCLCIFAMIENPSELDQKVYLVLNWSFYRLEGSMVMDTDEKRRTASYVCAVLEPSYEGTTSEARASTHGDGLSIAQNNADKPVLGLGSRNIDTTNINYDMIWDWLSLCEAKHQTSCARPASDDLKSVRLINVHTRRIVKYSDDSRNYLALSYVWGNTVQLIPGAGEPGRKLSGMPKTIEDAMYMAKRLGISYLWVDSVCIDQANETQLAQQISIMNEIYQSAYATIIAFSSTHADEGLPRISVTTPWRQMACTVDGVKLLGFGPTLSNLVWHMPWGQRGWTYQEALLSPRCIYVSKYQIFFECNAITCCESIDETYSHIHQTSEDGNYLPLTNTGVLRNPFTIIPHVTNPGVALSLYSTNATLFSRRALKKPSDALSAFSGILQTLQKKAYTDGFFWGLPIVHLNWALSWQAHNAEQAERAETGRRSMFPTWSWLSWPGGIWPGKPEQDGPPQNPRGYPFDLSLSKYSTTKETEEIFTMSYNDMTDDERRDVRGDPLADIESFDCDGSFDISSRPDWFRVDHILFFEGFILHFALESREEPDDTSDFSWVSVNVNGTILNGTTSFDARSLEDYDKHTYLLVARSFFPGSKEIMIFELLMLRPRHGFWMRVEVVHLQIPRSRLTILKDLGLRRMRGALV